jgi:small subunit ribosomal protein S9
MAATAKNHYNYGLGRRKSATASARLTAGKGAMSVNGHPVEDHFDRNEQHLWRIKQPLTLVGLNEKYDVSLHITGGGHSGQVDAAVLAISKAVSDLNEDLRSTLKRAGYLKRDPREKERKKFGLRRARKKEQYSKR